MAHSGNPQWINYRLLAVTRKPLTLDGHSRALKMLIFP